MLWIEVLNVLDVSENGGLKMENGKFIYVGKFLLQIFGLFKLELENLSIPKKEQKCR